MYDFCNDRSLHEIEEGRSELQLDSSVAVCIAVQHENLYILVLPQYISLCCTIHDIRYLFPSLKGSAILYLWLVATSCSYG